MEWEVGASLIEYSTPSCGTRPPAELPLQWLHLDGDDTLPVQLDINRVSSVLSLPFTEPDTFWKLP